MRIKRWVGLGLAMYLCIGSSLTAYASTGKTITSVTDVKVLPEKMYYCGDAPDGVMQFSREGVSGKGYVDINFNTVMEPFDVWNKSSVYTQGNFNGGLAPIGFLTPQNSLTIMHWYLMDTTGKQVADLSILSDLRTIPNGQDPNGVIYFGVTFFKDGARAVSYKSDGEVMYKDYHIEDYPQLTGANYLGSLVDGKIAVKSTSITDVKNEGTINQETYYNYKQCGTFDLLCNYYPENQQVSQTDKYRNDSFRPSTSANYSLKFPTSGAYFEKTGDKYVLKDASGNVKMEMIGSHYTTDSFQIVNDDTFIGRPYGSGLDSPWHLYKIQYMQ